MKYCTKCGAKLIEGAKFCTVCGSSVEQGAPAQNVQTAAEAVSAEPQIAGSSPVTKPEKKKSKWGILAAVLGALIVIGIAAAVLIPKLLINPPRKFVEMHRAIITPVIDFSTEAVTNDLNPERAGKLKEYTGVDTDFTVTLQADTGSYVADDIISDSSVTFKVKSDPEKPIFGFILNLSGSDMLSGTFVTEKDRIGISLPELSDEYYQIRYEDLNDILTALGLDSEIDIQTMLDAFGGKSPLGVDSKQLKAIIDSYLEVFFSMVKKENTTSSKEDVHLPGCGETVGCTVITFRPTADDITEMVHKFCDKLKDDEQVRDIVKNVAEFAYISDPGMTEYYDSADDYVKFILDSYDDTVQNLWNKNEEEIITFAKDAEANEISWQIGYKALRVHMICITDKNGSGFGYESVGNILEQRTDLIAFYEDEAADVIAKSELQLTGKNAEGKIAVYDLDDVDARFDFSVDLTKKSGLKIPYGSYGFVYGDIRTDIQVYGEGTGSKHDIKTRYEDVEVNMGIYSTDRESTAKEPSQEPTRVTSDNIMSVIQEMSGRIMEIFVNIYG